MPEELVSLMRNRNLLTLYYDLLLCELQAHRCSSTDGLPVSFLVHVALERDLDGISSEADVHLVLEPFVELAVVERISTQSGDVYYRLLMSWDSELCSQVCTSVVQFCDTVDTYFINSDPPVFDA